MYFATNSTRPATPSPRSLSASRSRLRAGARWGSRLGFMGNDGEILAQMFAGQTGAPAAANVQNVVAQAMSNGLLYTAENCSGVPASSNILGTTLQAGGAVALKIAPATGPAAPFLLIAGGVMQLFGAIFGHHAAKVKQEQQIICAVVAGCNDTFTTIDQLVQTGQISAQQASQALDGMFAQLTQQVQPILKQDKDHCNAACFILAEARGVIAKKKDQYSRIPPANAPAGSYQLSCRNMAVNGDTLNAECQDRNGNWIATSLSQLSTCAAIDNVNGQLQCTVPRVAQALLPANAPPGAAVPQAASSSVDLVNSLAASTGMPSWALWGAGALLLWKVLG